MNNSSRVKTILILAANPKSTSRLRLDEEVREIYEGLRRANKREQFKLEQQWAVRQRDFYRAILECQPQIVHFSGHGTGEDGIVLEDETGQLVYVKADALASMFKLFATKGVECVLLNACYSEVQAKAISQYVNYVIGMNRTVGDKAAVAFSVAFYDAIAAGEQMEFAYELGCSQMISSSEQQTPVLLKKDLLSKIPIRPTDPSLGPKKKKITYTASPQGVERAENALKRLGFDSKINFAKSQLLARNTVNIFFHRKPIQLDSFKKICDALKLNWREIAEITEEEQAERLGINDCSSSDIYEEVEAVQILRRKVTVTDKQRKIIKAEIILKGDINSVHNFKILQLILQEYSGDTIEIIDIKEGSIRIIVEGSQEDIKRLISQFQSGELTEVSGFPVENIQILNESSDNDEDNEPDDKWRLVQEIVSQPTKGRNLSGADLSDADLRGADLSDTDLSGADLSGADLSGADLSGADLNDADLSGADLSYAYLSNAYLSYAYLSYADLSRANLSRANLSNANLSNAYLSNAYLSNAYLSNAYLSNAYLSGANLSYTNLSNANLSRAYLKGATINEKTQIDGKWRLVWEIVNQGAFGRDLSNADLSRAYLSDADLSRAYLRGADLRGAYLSDAYLSRADLSRANLSDAYLTGAYLTGANLGSANLSSANLSLANLSFADLSGVNLSYANLSHAILEDAIVVNALFGGSVGLTEDMKRDLEQRGAIFGDHPPVLIPR